MRERLGQSPEWNIATAHSETVQSFAVGWSGKNMALDNIYEFLQDQWDKARCCTMVEELKSLDSR